MSTDPKWLADMRSHYKQTGRYRIEDVHRVLGDPRVTVTIPIKHSGVQASAQLSISSGVLTQDAQPR